jgi:hypothetical protein
VAGLAFTRAADVLGLQALRPLLHVELDPLAFVERAVAVGLNGRVVDEDVFTGVALDETESFVVVEPLAVSVRGPPAKSAMFGPRRATRSGRD